MRRTKKRGASAQLKKDAQLGRELTAMLWEAVPDHGPRAAVGRLMDDLRRSRWEADRLANMAAAYAQTMPDGRPWVSGRSRKIVAWALREVFGGGRIHGSENELRELAPITFDDLRVATDELAGFRQYRQAAVDKAVRLLSAFHASGVDQAATPAPRPEVQVAPEVPGASPSLRTLKRSRK